MAAPHAARLILEIEIGVDPIRGTVQVENGPTETFRSWLELVSLLERARLPGSDTGLVGKPARRQRTEAGG